MRRSRLRSALFASVVVSAMAVAFTSCVKDEYEGPDPDLPTRTVLVYLAGDNNLSELGEMAELLRAAWTYTGNRCLVYYDAADAAPVLLSLRGGCSTWPEPWIETVAEYAEENSASAEVFARVLDDVVRSYPADSYGLVYASHASGWLPAGTLADPRTASRSIGIDRTPGTLGGGAAEMELADFAAAIPDGQFDFIIFEACLMAGVEVAYALRNKTDYIVASSAEMLVPGFIPIWRQNASRLLFDTSLSVEQSLVRLAEAYYGYMDAQSGAYRSATLSIIKTERLNILAARAAEIYSTALSELSDIGALQRFDRPGSYGDTPAAPRYFDLGECLERMATAVQWTELEPLFSEIVVWKAATPTFMSGYNGFTIERHSGLTTYIEQELFPELNEAYRLTEWYQMTRQ